MGLAPLKLLAEAPADFRGHHHPPAPALHHESHGQWSCLMAAAHLPFALGLVGGHWRGSVFRLLLCEGCASPGMRFLLGKLAGSLAVSGFGKMREDPIEALGLSSAHASFQPELLSSQ